MDVALIYGGYSYVLNGTGAAVPLRAGRLDQSDPSTAVIECALDGTPAQIAAWQSGIERALVLAERYYGLPGEDWAKLQVTLADATVWQTPIQSGICQAVAPGPGARAGGSQGVKITIQHDPYWQSTTLTDCPLTNRFGTNITGGINSDNHDDLGHDDWVNISNTAVLGDVSTPAILTITASPNGMDIYVGQLVTSSMALVTVLEAESYTSNTGMTACTPTGDATCSNNNYVAMTWNGAAVVAASIWQLNTGADFAGRIFRPVMRLRDLIAGGETYYAWWRVGYWNGASNETIQDFEGIVLSTATKMQVFPPMPIPPWPKPPAGYAWENFSLSLMVQAVGAGAHAMNLDFVQFFPTEGFIHFLPVISTITYTLIRYDGSQNQISRQTTGGVTHIVEGGGLMLVPGQTQKIVVAGVNGTTWDINTLYTIRVQYYARKRVL